MALCSEGGRTRGQAGLLGKILGVYAREGEDGGGKHFSGASVGWYKPLQCTGKGKARVKCGKLLGDLIQGAVGRVIVYNKLYRGCVQTEGGGTRD